MIFPEGAVDDLIELLRGGGRGVKTMAESTSDMMRHPVRTGQSIMKAGGELGKAVGEHGFVPVAKEVGSAVAEDLKERGSTPGGLGELLGENFDPRSLAKSLLGMGAAKAILIPSRLARGNDELLSLAEAKKAVSGQPNTPAVTLKIEKDTGWLPQLQDSGRLEMFREIKDPKIDFDRISDLSKNGKQSQPLRGPEYMQDDDYMDRIIAAHARAAQRGEVMPYEQYGASPVRSKSDLPEIAVNRRLGKGEGQAGPRQIVISGDLDPREAQFLMDHEFGSHVNDMYGGMGINDIGGTPKGPGRQNYYNYIKGIGERRARTQQQRGRMGQPDRQRFTPGEHLEWNLKRIEREWKAGKSPYVEKPNDLELEMLLDERARRAGVDPVRPAPEPSKPVGPRVTPTADDMTKRLEALRRRP